MPEAGPARPVVRILGRIPYADALVLQQEAAAAVQAGEGVGTIFILEHEPVITLGANRPINTVLGVPPGVVVVQTDRGGGATVHNPGQLVVYPVVALRGLGFGVKGFVAWVLELWPGVSGGLRRGGGLPSGPPWAVGWGGARIASFGMHVSRGVATHGIAINLDNDLALFDAIVPCGLAGVAMTSVAVETGQTTAMAEAMARMAGIVAAGLPGAA